ncbi:longitudinals lacking protein, isoforms H/M/V isoform X3 [Culex quinquefasciatus]|uniref:longitudinals lacking protein, isoforms H/M/V isoform X3 n=1 Tax=Culex quinquefasciatus TaxID=7176 RepID=UPI0018E3E8AD|nr:longitudinals lacking protein, isoforms H/M/V isoform X3 [Culex quinquefasciatus]
MDDDQQFCLRWNNHQSTLISVFDTLLENGTLVDCTLAAEGKFLKAHKVVLSACSPYFAALLSQQYDKHPIFILKDVKFQELRAMMDYMYRGEVNISQDQLAALLKAAESLQIKGLSDNRGSSSSSAAPPSQQKQQQSETAAAKTLPPPVPVNKASGLTIENKRPLKSELHDSDLSGSREGSTSPTSRKRKKVRRGSVDTNNLTDNHDQHSNSSSHSMHSSLQPQALALTSGSSAIVASVPAINNAATSLSSSSTTAAAVVAATSAASAVTSANVLAATASAVAAAASAAIKKTESVQQQQVAEALKLQLVKQHLPTSTQQQQQQQLQKAQDTEEDEELSETEHGDGHGDDDSDNELDEPQSKRRQAQGGDGEDGKSINQSELMIEPKNEYDDGQDENVEDLTLDEEELLDDLDQAGPSHGEGSSQGYAQWQMEREQNEAFMAAQDAVGGPHRDAQEGSPTYTSMSSVSMPTSVIATDTDDESFIHLESLYDAGAKVEATPSDFMDGGSSLLTGGDPPLVTADLRRTTVHESQSQVEEIISYQRYGKIDKTVFSKQKFKCHLCGFGCLHRDTLLKHFDESHPL